MWKVLRIKSKNVFWSIQSCHWDNFDTLWNNKKTSCSATVEFPKVSFITLHSSEKTWEFQVNNKITDSTILTVWLAHSVKFSFISSSIVQKALLEFRFFFFLVTSYPIFALFSVSNLKTIFIMLYTLGLIKTVDVCVLDAYFFSTCHELLHEHISVLLICLFLLILLESSPASFRQNISQQ